MKKIILLILPFLLCGCYNYTELNNLGIISSIYIDYKNNNYNISLELYNEEDILSSSDTSIKTTLLNIENNSNKMLQYSHLNTVFISDNVNYNDVINYFLRQTDTNITFYIVLTNESPYHEKNIGFNTKKNLDNYHFIKFIDIAKEFYENKNTLLPILIDNKINSFKYIKTNKIISIDDYYLYRLLNNETNSYFKIPCNNNYFVINIYKNNYKNNSMDLESSISEYTCNLDTTKIESINKLEELSNNYLKEQLFNFNNKNINVNNHINKKGLILK